MAGWRGIIDEFREWLDLPTDCRPVTLQEGNTPLLHAPLLSALLGIELHLKL